MTIPLNWLRAASGLGLIAFWTGIIFWLRPGRSPAMIAATLLGLFLIYPLYAFLKPATQHDPAMAAAQGSLFGIVLCLILLLSLLGAGVAFHRQGLVWTAFVASLLPVFAVSCGSIVYYLGLCLKN